MDIPPLPFYVKASKTFSSKNNNQLSFCAGDVIQVNTTFRFRLSLLFFSFLVGVESNSFWVLGFGFLVCFLFFVLVFSSLLQLVIVIIYVGVS